MAVRKETAEAESRALPFKKNRGELKAYNLRLYEGDYDALRQHFDDQGTPVAVGIRQILRQYIRENL